MTQHETSARKLAAILDWYLAMGVDCTLEDAPANWQTRQGAPVWQGPGIKRGQLPPKSKAAEQQPALTGQRASRPATMAPELTGTAAGTAARAARNFAELEMALKAFEGCGLRATAKNLCFYRGSTTARLAVIGEAPGREEDIEGKPFVGRAGRLLDKMLAAIGLGEADVHITNIVYWRPPGNRTPTPQEAQVCRPFLERQIELLAPAVIVLLGGAAAKNVLGVGDGIMRLRGKWRHWNVGGVDIPVLATLHPAYLLRTPAAKRLAWRDLLALRDRLDEQD